MAKSRLSDWQVLKKELIPHLKIDPKTYTPIGLPSTRYFQQIGRHDLVHAIIEQHGGFQEVRRKLDLPQVRLLGKSSLMHDENLFAALRPFVNRLGRLPTIHELQIAGERRVASALCRKKVERVAELMGIKPKTRYGKRSLQIPANLDEVIREAGLERLTESELKERGRADILGAFHRGAQRGEAQRRFGMRITSKKPTNPFKEWEKLKRELEEIQCRIGHFPNSLELAAIKRHDVNFAIYKYHGGINAVRERFGIIKKKYEAKELTEKERQLLEEARSGEKSAVQKVFEHWKHLIDSETRNLRWHWDYVDLRQEASAGLLEAIKRRKSTSRFNSYARLWIRGEVLKWMRSRAILKINRTQRARQTYISTHIEEMQNQLGRKPTLEELSQATGFTLEELGEIMMIEQARKRPKLLGEHRGREYSGEMTIPRGKQISGRIPQIEHTIDLARLLRKIIDRDLTGLHRFLVCQAFGIEAKHNQRVVREAETLSNYQRALELDSALNTLKQNPTLKKLIEE